MAGRDEAPTAVLFALATEARDHALAALVIAVEEVDAKVALLDRPERRLAVGVVVVTPGALPEAELPGRDVEVAGQPAEILRRRMVLGATEPSG